MAANAKNILVIDGGGFRGLTSLLVIDHIMKAVITRSRKNMLPCEVFDLICGTSVGGLIAVLLGRLGMDCATAIEVYEEAVRTIFEGQVDNTWKRIANSESIDAFKFRHYMTNIVGNVAGSPEIAMKMALDERDPREHKCTKSFVTVMEGAPDHPSLTHCIRSYTPQKRDTLPPSSNRHWTIPEIVEAAMASFISFHPLTVKTDKQRSFQDAGFGGFNNATELAMTEFQKIWPRERLETVVSIGTGLKALLPKSTPHTREWTPMPQYTRTFSKQIFNDRLPGIAKDDDIDLNVTYAMRELIRMALDSSIVHHDFNAKRPRSTQYFRIDESFGLSPLDLVDIYHADVIRDGIDRWVKGEGAQFVKDVASKLVDENHNFADKHVASLIKPPTPPSGSVIEGYNPHLDEPRPAKMQDYLRDYEVLFVVDDSDSMKGSRWQETHDALVDIALYAWRVQAHTISLRFLNNDYRISGLQGSEQLKTIFQNVIPCNGTPTGRVLQSVFDEHLNRLDQAVKHVDEYRKVPPLDIIVLTDGVPTDTPSIVIENTVDRLRASKYHPNTMGVQFVQIGDESKAKDALKELVKGHNGSIVDTVPYRGVLTPDRLERILLGGIHPNVRAMIPMDWLAA
ncbi:hypothetical protein AX17_007286 [Amanita inopinata Kibby_2008]|nr:hypothetical protein AX17_007286 [Amanita inopinata Kibby_2008]